MTFYRYIRPVKFNEQRIELDTSPRGGICLRFEEYNNKLWFTHSRCHADELFSKEVAKRIADTRAKAVTTQKLHVLGYLGDLPCIKDTSTLVEHVIDWCLNWVPPEDAGATVRQYLRVEQRQLGSALHELTTQNAMERLKAEIWKEGMAAAQYKRQYEALK
jgi:hypothetical protein